MYKKMKNELNLMWNMHYIFLLQESNTFSIHEHTRIITIFNFGVVTDMHAWLDSHEKRYAWQLNLVVICIDKSMQKKMKLMAACMTRWCHTFWSNIYQYLMWRERTHVQRNQIVRGQLFRYRRFVVSKYVLICNENEFVHVKWFSERLQVRSNIWKNHGTSTYT